MERIKCKHWEKFEIELLVEWIMLNKKEARHKNVKAALMELFPDRTAGSVYSRWLTLRKALGFTDFVGGKEPYYIQGDLPLAEAPKNFDVNDIFTEQFKDSLINSFSNPRVKELEDKLAASEAECVRLRASLEKIRITVAQS